MSEYSKIEWTESTWNPTTGCRKISPACENCYAETFANRFRGVQGHPYEQGFTIKLWPNRLNIPLYWKKPRMIFVDSMSDLFLEEIPDEFIQKIFNTMIEANWHIFQILTKRAERMLRWCDSRFGGNRRDNKLKLKHIWMGVSVENEDCKYRIDYLKKVPAKIRFLSFEPLLGPINLDQKLLKGINWVIVGGESGSKARPMKKDWVIDILRQCRKANVKFFFKQWGGINKKKNGRELDGKIYDEFPLCQANQYRLFRD